MTDHLIEAPDADPRVTAETRETALRWFTAQASGDARTMMDCLDRDIEFINYNVVPGWNDAMPWIGTFRGFDATVASFKTFIETCEPQSERLLRLVCQGEQAAGAVHEVTKIRATGRLFEIEFVQWMVIRNHRIVRWKSYTDPSTILRAIAGEGPLAEESAA
jgi:hypothetical protein